MENQKLTLKFSDAQAAEASRYASELATHLRGVVPGTDVEVSRTDPDSQDFGTTLVLVFGTPVAVALAKGISDWLRMRQKAKITIVSSTGNIKAENLTSRDAVKLGLALSGKNHEPDHTN